MVYACKDGVDCCILVKETAGELSQHHHEGTSWRMCLIHVINSSCQKAKISSELKNLTEFSCILWNTLPMEFYCESTLSFLRNTKWNFWSLPCCLFSWDNTYAMDWSIKINYSGARQLIEGARHCENADSLYHHHHPQFYQNRHANYCTLILLKLGKKKPFCQNFDFTPFKFSSLFYSDSRNVCRINEKDLDI